MPLKRRRDEIRERGAAQQMVECPAGRRMSDDHDPRAVKGMREIVYERLNALDELAIAPWEARSTCA